MSALSPERENKHSIHTRVQPLAVVAAALCCVRLARCSHPIRTHNTPSQSHSRFLHNDVKMNDKSNPHGPCECPNDSACVNEQVTSETTKGTVVPNSQQNDVKPRRSGHVPHLDRLESSPIPERRLDMAKWPAEVGKGPFRADPPQKFEIHSPQRIRSASILKAPQVAMCVFGGVCMAC